MGALSSRCMKVVISLIGGVQEGEREGGQGEREVEKERKEEEEEKEEEAGPQD